MSVDYGPLFVQHYLTHTNRDRQDGWRIGECGRGWEGWSALAGRADPITFQTSRAHIPTHHHSYVNEFRFISVMFRLVSWDFFYHPTEVGLKSSSFRRYSLPGTILCRQDTYDFYFTSKFASPNRYISKVVLMTNFESFIHSLKCILFYSGVENKQGFFPHRVYGKEKGGAMRKHGASRGEANKKTNK